MNCPIFARSCSSGRRSIFLGKATVDHIISCVPKCNEKKLEKGPTRKTKNLFARLSLQFACQGF
jgi:hypothetical protein